MCQYLVAVPGMSTCVYFQKLCILAPAAATFHSDILHPFNICVFMWTSWLRSLRIPTLWHHLISFSTVAVVLRCKLFYNLLELYKVKVDIQYTLEEHFIILWLHHVIIFLFSSQPYLLHWYFLLLSFYYTFSPSRLYLQIINSCWWEASTKAQHSSIIYIMCVKKSVRVAVHLVAHSHLTTRLQ